MASITRRAVLAERSGFCENCRVRFNDLHGHINSRFHQKFAKNPANYKDLDALLVNLKRRHLISGCKTRPSFQQHSPTRQQLGDTNISTIDAYDDEDDEPVSGEDEEDEQRIAAAKSQFTIRRGPHNDNDNDYDYDMPGSSLSEISAIEGGWECYGNVFCAD
jgi:hypothetical protein